jgi:hypothetical protein
MSDYYIRVKASDRAEMRRVLRAINVIRVIDGEIQPRRDGDAWQEVGRIENWQAPGQWVKEPVSGEAYWHYNLRTGIRLKARIRELTDAGDPDALILDSAKGRWFSKADEDVGPDFPKQVWL